jgi:hypothetical protein
MGGELRKWNIIFVGKPEGKEHSEDLCVDGSKIRLNFREIG